LLHRCRLEPNAAADLQKRDPSFEHQSSDMADRNIEQGGHLVDVQERELSHALSTYGRATRSATRLTLARPSASLSLCDNDNSVCVSRGADLLTRCPFYGLA